MRNRGVLSTFGIGKNAGERSGAEKWARATVGRGISPGLLTKTKNVSARRAANMTCRLEGGAASG
jgi:hypothetical protein